MLKIGFSRVDVTPPLGTSMTGYFEARKMEGMLDPIYLNSIAFYNGEETAIIITGDFLGIPGKFVNTVRADIAQKTGVKENFVIIQALHQHTSITPDFTPDPNNNVTLDRDYISLLMRKFADVAVMAVNDMSDAELFASEMQTEEEISFIRRFRLKDGTAKTNANNPELIAHPLGESDNTVRLLRFKREGKNDIAVVNFQTHPDVIGGRLLSADWPGFARTYVERDLEGVHCILLNGTQGDTNHTNRMAGVKNNGVTHSRHMGRVVANAVINMWDNGKPVTSDFKISGDVKYSSQRVRTDGIELYDECVEKMQGILDGMVDREALNHVGGRGGARRIINIRTSPIFKHIPISVISLGSISFVGFGGEPFTHYSQVVRAACPEQYILTMCCANSYEGYLPTASAFSEGGYEASSSPYFPTLEDDCTSIAIEMIKKQNNK